MTVATLEETRSVHELCSGSDTIWLIVLVSSLGLRLPKPLSMGQIDCCNHFLALLHSSNRLSIWFAVAAGVYKIGMPFDLPIAKNVPLADSTRVQLSVERLQQPQPPPPLYNARKLSNGDRLPAHVLYVDC